jgi:hypothetical protein
VSSYTRGLTKCEISHQDQSYIDWSGAVRQALVEQTNKKSEKATNND